MYDLHTKDEAPMLRSSCVALILSCAAASAATVPDLWSSPQSPAATVELAALFTPLPSPARITASAPLSIRSASQAIHEDLTFYGPDQLAASSPSSLKPGSPEELVLQFISALEAPRGYNDYFRGVRLPPPQPITQMPLGEVMAWQAVAGKRRAGYKPASVAVGGYQVITSTLARVADKIGLDPALPFDAAMQDKIGLHLLYARGFGAFLDGEISLETMGNNLAREWAALPCLSGPDAGKSAYWRDGVNRALVSTDVLRAVLEEALALSKSPADSGETPLIVLTQQ